MLRKLSNATVAASISGATVYPATNAVASTPVIVTYTTTDAHNLYVGARVTISGLSSTDANNPNVTRQVVYRLDGPKSFSVILPTTNTYTTAPTISLTSAGVYGTMYSVNPALSSFNVKYSQPVVIDRPTFYNYVYPTLTATATGKGINLVWEALGVANPPISTYKLERITGTNTSIILSNDATGTFLDADIATIGSASAFSYKMTALNENTSNSASANAVTLYIGNIGSITAVPVSSVENTILISWTAPTTNAVITSYEISRTSNGIDWTSLVPESGPIPPSQLSYVDGGAADGVAYTYRVRAKAAYAVGDDVYSNYKLTASTVKSYYMTAPATITATAAAGIANRINISWAAVTVEPSTVTYELQENLSINNVTYGSWTTVQTSALTSFSRTNALAGYYYKYRVRAINSQLTSAYLESTAAQAYYLADPLPAPTVTNASGTNYAITISATNNAIPTITGYNIRRSADAGANWTNIGATNYSITLPYTDSTTATNTSYVYAVKATNGQLTTANWSATSASIISYAAPNAPTNFTAVSGTTGSDINLSWTAATVPASSPAVSNYKLERSQTSDFTGTTAVVVTSGISPAATTYNDTGRSLSVTYYYRLSAINSVGTGPVSTTANATITLIPGNATVSVASTTAFNEDATISVSTNANRSVKLQSSPDNSTWTDVETKTASAAGATSFTYTITRATTLATYFRVVVSQDAIYLQTTSSSASTTTTNNTLNIATYSYSEPNTGTNNTLTLSITDANGTAVPGTSVQFKYLYAGQTVWNNYGSAVTTDANGRASITYGVQYQSIAWAGVATKTNYTQDSTVGRSCSRIFYNESYSGPVDQSDYQSHAEAFGWGSRSPLDGYMYSGWWSTNQDRQAGSAYFSDAAVEYSYPAWSTWANINNAHSIRQVLIDITRKGGTGGTGMNISYGVHNSKSRVVDFDNLTKATNLIWGATNRPAYSAGNNRDYDTDISAIKNYFLTAARGGWSTDGAKGLTFGHQTEATTQDNYAVINSNVTMYFFYTTDPIRSI